MVRHMSVGVLAAALAMTVLVGGCNKKQTMTQAPPPPVADAPPPPDTYGAGYNAPAATAPAPEPVFLPAAAPAPATSGGGQTYVVQKGDTLYSISRKVYGTPTRVKDIVAANGIADPNKIKVGQTLVLP